MAGWVHAQDNAHIDGWRGRVLDQGAEADTPVAAQVEEKVEEERGEERNARNERRKVLGGERVIEDVFRRIHRQATLQHPPSSLLEVFVSPLHRVPQPNHLPVGLACRHVTHIQGVEMEGEEEYVDG